MVGLRFADPQAGATDLVLPYGPRLKPQEPTYSGNAPLG